MKPHRKIRLVATDLDGTFLDSEGRAPERSIAAARRARAAGVSFAIATGRMFASAKIFAELVGADAPVLCYNGAMLRRLGGETLYHRPLELPPARACLELMRERGIYVQSYVGDELLVHSASAREYEFYLAHYGVIGRAVGDDLYAPATAPTKLLAMTSGIDETHDLINAIKSRVGGDVYTTSSDPIFVEIMHPAVSKSGALRALADGMGIDMDEVLAIGDGENDADMLRESGIGVAMGNARALAKEAADFIAPTNDKCGAAWAIERFVLGDEIEREN